MKPQVGTVVVLQESAKNWTMDFSNVMAVIKDFATYDTAKYAVFNFISRKPSGWGHGDFHLRLPLKPEDVQVIGHVDV